MRLDPDCVRDILLTIESNDFGSYMNLGNLHIKLPKYSIDELRYCCLKLNEAGYLDIISLSMLGDPVPQIKTIKDLTFQGHEFLSNIKSDTNWNKTKDIAKKVGSFSLNTLKDISVQVISSVISSNI